MRTHIQRFILPRTLLTAVTVMLLVAVASAQSNSPDSGMSDFMNVYNTTTGKITQLADAIPADTYDWRPAEGIRSVHEVVLHLAAGNYYFISQIGVELPEGVNPRSFEDSGMNREQAISTLEESIEFIKNAVSDLDTAELNQQISLFGSEMSKRQVVFMLGDHAAEHLGQLIAYARSNSIAPPWSQ